MRNRPLCTFTLDRELIDGLATLRERDGATASESVRRALRAWLRQKGVPVGELASIPVIDDEELPPGWDFAPSDPEADSNGELDEADFELVLRALRRLRLGRQQEERRRRLIARVESELRAAELGA